jgi:hypothetical protein
MRCTLFTATLLAATLGSLAGCRQHPVETHPAGQKPVALQLPQGTPMRPQGLPAIKTTPGSPAPLSKNDVASYFTTHNLPSLSAKTGQVHVVSVEFLTSKQVSDRLQGESTGIPDGDPVAFATLSGTFTVSSPLKTKLATFSSAYAVFDGGTGNLLMAGVMGSGKSNAPSVK